MRLSEAAEPMFARHETFHPRYGWFRKAYSTAVLRQRGFSEADAPINMGVGKNMVRAIKFWGQAAKIITKDPDSENPRSPEMIPTRFGHALFCDDGWDPYMEDPGTIWLLHWMLLAPPSLVPVWWIAFNDLHAVEFDDETLEAAVQAQLDATSKWTTPHHSSIRKDISALLRTYAPAVKSGRTGFDDLLDCPLRELALITASAATGDHRFVLGEKPTLPDEIVLFAALDYLSRRPPSGQTVTLSHLANEPGGPGRAFKLSENDLLRVLQEAENTVEGVGLLSPTGAHQLVWTGDPCDAAVEVLHRYYGTGHADARAGAPGDEPVAHDELPEERHDIMARLLDATETHPVGAGQ